MNILVTADEKYILPLKVMLKSLFMNNSGVDISIYFMHRGLNTDILKDLELFVCSCGAALYDVRVNRDIVKKVMKTDYLTEETYYRCFAYMLLPPALNKILSLDVDLIINQDLSELYQMDFEDNYLIAADDLMDQLPIHKSNLGIPLEKTYFNTGVMLLNLYKFRNEFHIEELYIWHKKYKECITHGDQDILNGLFFDSAKIIPSDQYNYLVNFRNNHDASSWNKKRILDRIAVLHYAGKKPWNIGYGGNGGVWWYYARRAKIRIYEHIYMINVIYRLCLNLFWVVEKRNPRLASTIKSVFKRNK